MQDLGLIIPRLRVQGWGCVFAAQPTGPTFQCARDDSANATAFSLGMSYRPLSIPYYLARYTLQSRSIPQKPSSLPTPFLSETDLSPASSRTALYLFSYTLACC